jgi:[acyl-carrier-protein] S-malonyltransferase
VLNLGVGAAFHTPFMVPARDRLKKILATVAFHDAEIPIVANVDARQHTAADDWERLLSAQLMSPVRWRQSVLRLGGVVERGTDAERLFVEVGSGDALITMVRDTLPSVTAVAVSRPPDLDRLVDAISGNSALHAYAVGHQGEHLYVSERVVISPGPGIFEPQPKLDLIAGTPIEVGTLLGTVGGVEVRSPFAGRLEGALARAGERVQTGQPIVWLHAS